MDYLKKDADVYIINNQDFLVNLHCGYLEDITSEFDPSYENNF